VAVVVAGVLVAESAAGQAQVDVAELAAAGTRQQPASISQKTRKLFTNSPLR